MIGQIVKSQIDKGIQVEIYSTMFLHSKEGQISMIGTRLQETKSSDNKRQNTTTFNWRGHWQIKGGKILQQIGLDLGI